MANSDIKVQWVDIKSITPNKKNRNIHPPEQIDEFIKQFKYQGFRQPLVVSNQTKQLVVGHGRLEAAKKMGLTKVPISFQDFEDTDMEYAFATADNALSQWSSLDMAGINLDLADLGPDLDISLLGIKDFELEPADKYADKDADAIPDVKQNECGVNLGDIYQLGEHRLMCGDSTDLASVEELMNGEKADMVFTDPPYGMILDTDYTSMNGTLKDGSYIRRNKYNKVIGDNEDFTPKLISSIFDSFDYVKECFIWGGDYFAELLPNRNEGSWVVWDKTGTESRDLGFGSSWELCWSKQKHKRTFARIWWQGIFGVKDDQKRCHPTQKPVQLAEFFFNNWGKKTKLVADLYLGSGSTLIACEKTSRKCYGMELDPHYCSVIIKRWQDFTGKKAKKLNAS